MLVKQNIHFSIFFEQSIRPRIPTSYKVSLSLVKAEVGTNKEKLDIVDLNLAIAPVVESTIQLVLNLYVFIAAVISYLHHLSNIHRV